MIEVDLYLHQPVRPQRLGILTFEETPRRGDFLMVPLLFVQRFQKELQRKPDDSLVWLQVQQTVLPARGTRYPRPQVLVYYQPGSELEKVVDSG